MERAGPPVPDAADGVFPDVDLAHRYADLLAGPGVVRGVLGPHEGARVWERHLLNSAVVHPLCPVDGHVVDLGSGAGLPGIPLALARPDLRVTLLEPLARRVAWLHEVVVILDLGSRVTVVRGRAESSAVHGDVVVSRAVAPLVELLPWSARLLRPGGRVVAMKGERAGVELNQVAHRLGEWGLVDARVARFGEGLLADPTTAVVADRAQRGGASDDTTVPRAARRRGAADRRRHVGPRRRRRRST
ncbi:MAG: 16S rRNA (guanine(527)-N(7))-methyltransferase RsmG [Kineosporiaceae bacterium]